MVQKNEYHFQISNFFGLKYNLSKSSNIEIVNNIGLGLNGINIKYQISL